MLDVAPQKPLRADEPVTQNDELGRQIAFNDDTDDPINARQIINGNDCDTKIAGYHDLFLAALEDAE